MHKKSHKMFLRNFSRQQSQAKDDKKVVPVPSLLSSGTASIKLFLSITNSSLRRRPEALERFIKILRERHLEKKQKML